MPGIATHHVFGREAREALAGALDAIAPASGKHTAKIDAFLLGNQGPDPFFYLGATPGNPQLRQIGSTLHRYDTAKLLWTMHDRFVVNGSGTTLAAYALGLLCHYLLDSIAHPLVYAQQYAICNGGVEDLKDEWAHRVVHATIETTLDEFVLTNRLGTTTAAMPPHQTMLQCPAAELLRISEAWADVVNRVYGIECPSATFAMAVGLNRTAQAALYSGEAGIKGAVARSKDLIAQRLGIRGRLATVPTIAGALAYAHALSHRASPLPRIPFANDDHTAWPHPFQEGRVVSESFDELYAKAMQKARETLPVFAQRNVSTSWFEEVAGHVNFHGRPVVAFQD